MKKLNLLFTLFIQLCLVTILFYGCKKGENILGTGYGQLRLTSTFSGGALPLLIQVDGETKDTLKLDKPGTLRDIILKEGEHKLILVNSDTKEILADSTFHLKPTQTLIMPKFFYTGTAALFEDSDPSLRPDRDSLLVRFATTDPTLPAVMNIQIILSYNSGGVKYIPLLNKNINGVRKDRFSNFIQLPNPLSLAPAGAKNIIYYLEGQDAVSGAKVMDIASQSMCFIRTGGGSGIVWVNNQIESMAIGPDNGKTKPKVPAIIFSRIIQ